MKLRLRLAITVVGVAVPVIVAIAWLHRHAEETAMRDGLTQLAVAAMESGQRARCEADPARWQLGPRRAFGAFHRGVLRGPPPGAPPPPRRRRPRRFLRRHRPMVPFRPRLFAYSASLASENPRAPAPDPKLVSALAAGESTAAGWSRLRGHRVYEVLVPMSWRTGPCAVILALAPGPRRPRPLLPPLAVWGLPTLAVLLAVLLAVGPVVRRIRRLTHAVTQTADAGWDGTIPVSGHDELGELARAFEAAGREIRARMAAQAQREQTLRDFLANTTHDVMIPLTVLEGHLDALATAAAAAGASAGSGSGTGSGTAGPGSGTADTIQAAAAEAQYIGALLHNLAAAAKLQAGAPAVAHLPLDLAELVERVAARYRPVARNAGVAFAHAVPGTPVPIAGDVTLVEQAASNLVYNAIRHNRPGGHVALTLDLEAASPAAPGGAAAEAAGVPGAGTFVLRVVDDGPGLPEGARDRLFERWARGDGARTRDPEGQGLGLHIAWRVCRLHGFTLSLEDAHPAPDAPAATAAGAATGPRGLEATIRGPITPPADADAAADDDAAP